MFKRTNKLIALLVAAVAVTSLGTNIVANASERLVSKEGNFEKAYSYDEGKYLYDGYLTEDDNTAIYFNNGEKDTEVENYDDYDFSESIRYGNKYITVKDGDDTYLLDLSTGKIDDEESLEDKRDNLKSKLKNTLKKTDRYENLKKIEEDDFSRVLEGQYGEVWYKYEAVGDKDAVETRINGKYIGFVNEEGKYIDTSYLANINIFSPEKKKTVKFEKFGDEKNINDTEKVRLTLKDIKVIDQDDDYLYAITIVDAEELGEHIYFQKIAKEQGEKKDGAYIPKSVSSYEIDFYQVYSDDDMKEAAEQLFKVFIPNNDALIGVKVKDNVINIATYDNNEHSKVKVYKLKYKKDKKDAYKDESKDEKIKKVDAYIVYKDGDCDEDVTTLNNANPASYDVYGNLWILGKGKIFRFDGSDFKEEYTCDRSITNLDVYDEKNLIAWDTEDVFTVLQNGKEATDSSNTEKDETAKAGWEKNADGTWSYYKDGAAVKGQWVQDGNWYYLKEDGIMATGWLQDKGEWYYLNASGAIVYGWFQDGTGNWYYSSTTTGAMVSNTTVEGYVLGANGAWVK